MKDEKKPWVEHLQYQSKEQHLKQIDVPVEQELVQIGTCKEKPYYFSDEDCRYRINYVDLDFDSDNSPSGFAL